MMDEKQRIDIAKLEEYAFQRVPVILVDELGCPNIPYMYYVLYCIVAKILAPNAKACAIYEAVGNSLEYNFNSMLRHINNYLAKVDKEHEYMKDLVRPNGKIWSSKIIERIADIVRKEYLENEAAEHQD